MMKRKWIKIPVIFFLFFLGTLYHVTGNDNVAEKPNIILIITDQLTASALSCAGNVYLHTPALDKLAESGIRFENNYVTQPLCLPFRSSLQTSRYPHEIGTINNGRKIVGDFPLLGNLMKTAGYQCSYIGKWHVGTTPEKAGYSDYDDVGIDEKKTDAACSYLLSEHKNPFFLTVSFMNPHNVCQLARADADGTVLPDGPIGKPPTELLKLPPLPKNFNVPENEPSVIRTVHENSFKQYPTKDWTDLTWRQYLWGYYRLVEKVDNEIGKILYVLNKSSYSENTVIIFTSDHGEGIAMEHWNQKQVLYDQVTRVPLIINWKGKTRKQVNKELVSNALDIPVTILDIAGVEKPASMLGESLVPVIEEKSHKPRNYVVSETMFAENNKPLGGKGRMIRTEKFKYCIYDNGENREQLFDMENDPGETNNLTVKKEFRDELLKHRNLLLSWAKLTKDNDFPYIIEQNK